MSTNLVDGIEKAYKEKTDLVVFALTGRTGSGCTTAAKRLSSQFGDLQLSEEELSLPERRKFRILEAYARSQWTPFLSITVSTVIFSFLLDEEWGVIEPRLAPLNLEAALREKLREALSQLRNDERFADFQQAMESRQKDAAGAWDYFHNVVHPTAMRLRELMGARYPEIFQWFGDNVRRSGSPTKSNIDPARLFRLMQRVRRLIAGAEVKARLDGRRGTRIVIDAIRNPLELVYLRDHFAGLHVIAITVDDDIRRARLSAMNLTADEITRIDGKEYSEQEHLADYPSFVSQNLGDCIQKADIFVANPGSVGEGMRSFRAMDAQLVRYVALALRPGLVTPTRDERCMQIAFVAKSNSGCISRQVGAAVADSDYSICALGWNDVPKGQVPCLLRDVDDLLTGKGSSAFSDYENSDPDLRKHLQIQFASRQALKEQKGLSCPFCFKDAYNTIKNNKNQVHTRSLHAEENAFLQLARRGGPGIEGGVLYTTASPCELCSKKAYQLGLREIVYVDPYPGISASHVLHSGDTDTRPQLRLFSGAVGQAYHRLYDPLLSIKDEYRARLAPRDGERSSERLQEEAALRG